MKIAILLSLGVLGVLGVFYWKNDHNDQNDQIDQNENQLENDQKPNLIKNERTRTIEDLKDEDFFENRESTLSNASTEPLIHPVGPDGPVGSVDPVDPIDPVGSVDQIEHSNNQVLDQIRDLNNYLPRNPLHKKRPSRLQLPVPDIHDLGFYFPNFPPPRPRRELPPPQVPNPHDIAAIFPSNRLPKRKQNPGNNQ